MMNRLLALLGIPAAAIALLFAATWFGRKQGWIPDGVAYYLYPSLVAIAFLVFAIIAFLREKRQWVWPLGAGFVAQLLGVFWLTLYPEKETSRLTAVYLYTLGAVALVLVLMGGIWLFNYFRTRNLEIRMAQGLAEGVEGNQAELGEIRKNMMEALNLLRRAGRGRNAIYELPWFLVMGRPAAGKTIAIKNSGLTLPVKKDWVKGVGGTYTVNFFFTNSLIFVDTPGKWVTDGADGSSQKLWKHLVSLLKKYRGVQPLDGLIVVVPADDLLSKDTDELADQAANTREVVDLIHKELTFRFPIYLLVSKSDLIEGFVDLFKSFGQNRRDEILGWSNPEPNKGDAATLVRKGFGRLYKRLISYRLDMLGRVKSRTRARKLFFFPEELKSLEEPLATFADEFFQSDRFHESPVFRGFYFTSGMQEGAPLSRAFAAMARTMGVTPRGEQFSKDEPSKSYFLLDLFRERMVDDDGLVGRTAGHWWKRRKATMLGAFAPAGLALILLLFSALSFIWNKNVYTRHERNASRIVDSLDAPALDPTGNQLVQVLDMTGQLREDYLKISSFAPLRSLGMRRPGDLEQRSLDLFVREFGDHVLQPTLAEAQSLATDGENKDCVERLEYLHGVMRLRMAEAFQDEADLEVFREIWSAGASSSAVQEKFRIQYRTYTRSANGDLLPGFSIKDVAESIGDDCGGEGSTSSLASYLNFQRECETLATKADVQACLTMLRQALEFDETEYDRIQSKLASLRDDLESLQAEEGDASIGLEVVDRIGVAPSPAAENCVQLFADMTRPNLEKYVKKGVDDLLPDCQSEARQAKSPGTMGITIKRFTEDQTQSLQDLQAELEIAFRKHNSDCATELPNLDRLSFPVFERIVRKGLRAGCLPQDGPVDTRRKPRKPVAPALDYLVAGGINRYYLADSWQDKKDDWLLQVQMLDADPSSQSTAEEKQRVRGEIRKFARDYAAHWESYLGALELRPMQVRLADWLIALSQTSEYDDVLQPAAEAIRVGSRAEGEALSAMRDGLADLDEFTAVQEKMAEYQELLGQVGQDLANEQDTAEFLAYQRGLEERDPRNSIIAGLDWVNRNVSRSMLDGRLRRLLKQPLEEAEEYVSENDSPLAAEWTGIVESYGTGIRGRAPLAADLSGEVVETDALVGLLGQASGQVASFKKLAGDFSLPGDVRNWLGRAEEWSDLLFVPGSDKLRPIELTVIVDPATYDSESTEKKYQLLFVDFCLGKSSRVQWESKDGTPWYEKLEMDLFPESRWAYVKGVLREPKKVLGITVGQKKKDLEPIWAKAAGETARFEVDLAPLKLIHLGQMEAGGSIMGATTLRYTIEHESGKKKGKVPTATLTIRLDGAEIRKLLELIENGRLGTPPESIIGG